MFQLYCHYARKARMAKKTARRRARNKKIYCYLCPDCFDWHITGQAFYKGKPNIKP